MVIVGLLTICLATLIPKNTGESKLLKRLYVFANSKASKLQEAIGVEKRYRAPVSRLAKTGKLDRNLDKNYMSSLANCGNEDRGLWALVDRS